MEGEILGCRGRWTLRLRSITLSLSPPAWLRLDGQWCEPFGCHRAQAEDSICKTTSEEKEIAEADLPLIQRSSQCWLICLLQLNKVFICFLQLNKVAYITCTVTVLTLTVGFFRKGDPILIHKTCMCMFNQSVESAIKIASGLLILLHFSSLGLWLSKLSTQWVCVYTVK